MIGVLVIAHGSRVDATEHTAEAICAHLRELLGIERIVVAYMEFRRVNIAAGLETLIGQGADDIKIVPYFLFDGVHIREDIPAEIAAFRETHPQVKLQFGRTLGADERLAQVLADRVRELL